MTVLSRRAVLIGVAALAACKKSQPGARCETCAMKLVPKHAFFAELEPAGAARIPYDTPRCAFAGLLRHPGAAMWVREYYEQTPRLGTDVRFVEHSDVIGPMGPDLVPVDPAKVTQFVTTHGGGRISSFEETLARFSKGQAE